MKPLIFFCAFSLTAGLFLIPAQPSRADDYGDATLTAADRAADIGSVYFFLDPNDNNFAVAAVTIGGFITPAMNSNLGFFDEGVKFVFAFENTGDATADYFVEVTHSAQTSRTVSQTATIKLQAKPTLLPNGATFTAPTTISRAAFGPQGPPTFGGGTSDQQGSLLTTHATNVSYFGGLIDDPFFFDQAAELAYRASRLANQTNPAILNRGRDSFAGYNTMAIVLKIPVALLTGTAGNKVGLNVYTQRERPVPHDKKLKKGESVTEIFNVDRMGNPFINNIFTSFAKKNLYNAADTTQDAAGVFLPDIDATLMALQTGATFRSIIENIYLTHGDMLRLDTSIPNTGSEGGKNPEASWPNGRRPNDDVMDTIITLVNDGLFQGDAVADNELVMRDSYPFFAKPHMPFPPGAGSEDLTRN